MKKVITILLATIFITGLIVILFFFVKNTNNDTYKDDCVNYQDKQFFWIPIPVVWTAKFGGCLVGCWGASFVRVPEDNKYPLFSGYVPDEGERIAEKYQKKDQILKIYGKWTDVSDSYGSVFNRMCVPTVKIDKIDIVK